MLYLVAHYFAHCSWIRSMAIRGHPFRRMTNHGKGVFAQTVGLPPYPVSHSNEYPPDGHLRQSRETGNQGNRI
jgi:hypothetical protein